MDSLKIKHPPYKPGDVIVDCKPLIYYLSPDIYDYCSGCFYPTSSLNGYYFTQNKLNKCSACLKASYCSVNCQKFDWINFHKYECKIFTQNTKNEKMFKSTFLHLAIRIYILIKYKKSQLSKKHKILGGQTRCFNDLMDHSDDFRKNDYKYFTEAINDLKSLGLTLDSDELELALFRLSINAFAVSGMTNLPIGTALYIESSIFNHSCRPNAGVTFDGLRQQVRAYENIDEDEPIFITYFNLCEPRAKRQENLWSNYFFTCQCSRCTDENFEEDDKEVAKLTSNCNEYYKILLKTCEDRLTADDEKLLLDLEDSFRKSSFKVYGNYNRFVTLEYIYFLELRVSKKLNLPIDVKMITDAANVTYGVSHPYYGYLKQLINNYEEYLSRSEALRPKFNKKF